MRILRYALLGLLALTVLLLADNARPASAESALEQWVARYDGPASDSDKAYAIAVDGSGNVYVTGGSQDNATNEDYATVKYDANGVQQWVARYDGPASNIDQARAIAVDQFENVYVTGPSKGNGTFEDYATVKYDASGAEQWVARYGGPARDLAEAIKVDGSGNVYVTGSSSSGSASVDYATVKYDASGVEQWVARYDGPASNHDNVQAIAVDGSGNVYVTGTSYGGASTGEDYATVKYDASGAEQWVARYDGPNANLGTDQDLARAIAVDASGNIYVTGGSTAGDQVFDYATVKYDATGVEQWVARYDGPASGHSLARAIIVGASGNVYVTGQSGDFSNLNDYATVKYNSSGVEQWASRYDSQFSGTGAGVAMAVDGAGNVYVTGASRGIGTAIVDYATLKYDNSGVEQWVALYDGPVSDNDWAQAIAVDVAGNVYVTGHSCGSAAPCGGVSTGFDFATVKYVLDADEDGVADSLDPCPANPDCDGDSLGLGDSFGLFFRDGVEVFLGTLPLVACPATDTTDDEDPDATGADFDDSQDVDGSDVFLFAQRFGAELGVPPQLGKLPYIPRFDIYPTAASLNKIDGSDVFVLATYFGTSCP